MGQAKRRGTYEERVTQAIKNKEIQLKIVADCIEAKKQKFLEGYSKLTPEQREIVNKKIAKKASYAEVTKVLREIRNNPVMLKLLNEEVKKLAEKEIENKA